MVRSCLGQFDHRIVDIATLGEVRRGLAKRLPRTLAEWTLLCRTLVGRILESLF